MHLRQFKVMPGTQTKRRTITTRASSCYPRALTQDKQEWERQAKVSQKAVPIETLQMALLPRKSEKHANLLTTFGSLAFGEILVPNPLNRQHLESAGVS